MNRKTTGALVLGGVTIAAALIIGYGGGPGADATAQEIACASPAGGHDAILTSAGTFLDSLDAGQRASAVQAFGLETAQTWSNLPAVMATRNGIRFADMSPTQEVAALGLISAATSECGRKLFDDIRSADLFLTDVNPRNYNQGFYYVGFVGEPSASAPWILQVSGHHIAYNFTFNGAYASATPLFDGVEPVSFELGSATFEPLAVQHQAMIRLASAIETAPGARLEGTFRDVTRGAARGGDTNFPVSYPQGDTDRGAAYSALSEQQKTLVQAAMNAWVSLPNEAISAPLVAEYLSPAALAETWVGFAGETSLNQQGSYVRIDGPRIWIEFVVQPAANSDGIHFHTIWRDKLADYGGAFRS